MDHDRNQVKLSDIVEDFFEKHRLPYGIYHETIDPKAAGVRANWGGSWLAWIYDTEVKSYWNEELICLKASDPNFFPMLEFWLAFNNQMLKDRLREINGKQ